MFFILIFPLNFSRERLKIDSLLCFPIFLSRYTLSIFRLRKRARYSHHQWIYFSFDTVFEVQLGFMYRSYQHCIKYRYFSLFMCYYSIYRNSWYFSFSVIFVYSDFGLVILLFHAFLPSYIFKSGSILFWQPSKGNCLFISALHLYQWQEITCWCMNVRVTTADVVLLSYI